MGEAAAAYCAGILDLNGAIDVACSTARLTETKLPEGLMGFVQATWAETTTLIADVRDRVAIAVERGAGLTVISGEASAVRRVLAIASARGIASGPLPLAQAYHSPDVASLGEAFRARLSNLRLRSPQIDSYSSVTAAVQNEPGVDHWWQICSKPARFYMLALAMIRDGYRRFIEIGPHPMISQTIEEAAAHRGVAVDVRASMRRGGSAMARQEACVAV
jgi:acyl transferase domain-containing protein